MESLTLPTSANQNLTVSMLGSPRKSGLRSTKQCLPAQHTLPDLAPRLPFAPYKESNPALINQQMPPSLPLLTLVYKNLSSSTALWSSFPSADWMLPDWWITEWKPTRSVNCLWKNFLLTDERGGREYVLYSSSCSFLLLWSMSLSGHKFL